MIFLPLVMSATSFEQDLKKTSMIERREVVYNLMQIIFAVMFTKRLIMMQKT